MDHELASFDEGIWSFCRDYPAVEAYGVTAHLALPIQAVPGPGDLFAGGPEPKDGQSTGSG